MSQAPQGPRGPGGPRKGGREGAQWAERVQRRVMSHGRQGDWVRERPGDRSARPREPEPNGPAAGPRGTIGHNPIKHWAKARQDGNLSSLRAAAGPGASARCVSSPLVQPCGGPLLLGRPQQPLHLVLTRPIRRILRSRARGLGVGE